MRKKKTRPNIVFVHADQLHHQSLSAYGNPNVCTPHLDQIAEEGVSFMLSHSANPVCCPARASWYTGRVSSEHGVVNNQLPLLAELPDLGQWMSARGYRCYYTGKWHIPRREVAQSFTLLPGGHSYGELGDAGAATAAEGFLAHDEKDTPFFLNVGFLNPHDCCYLTFAPKTPATKFESIPALRADLPPLPGGYDPHKPFHSPEGGTWDEDRIRFFGYCYYRMVEMVDAEIGRIYQALQSSRHRDNTLFVFTSDHGEMLGHQNQFKKGCQFDAAVRVPLILSWPSQVKGGGRDETHLVSGVDIPATILDYAGLPAMPDMSIARSLRPLLEGQALDWRDYVVSESYAGGPVRSIRTAQFKAVFFQNGQTRLHDMVKDPLEKMDLVTDPDHAEVLQEHKRHHNEFVSMIKLHPEYQDFGPVA